ncbi:GVQW3 protein, partial [Acromyrmex insinuator]
MERSLEQRYAIKFCVRLGKNATETFQMLQEAFKDDCISRSQSERWHKAFKEGREEVADEPRSRRPTTARTDENVNREIVANYLVRSNTPVVPQPPYSPDLTPCDFFLFPLLKRELKGKHWESVENIQKHVTMFLRDIPVEEFQRAFQA